MTGHDTARDHTLDVLEARGVRHMFGNPGTTELDLISALPDEIEYVLCLQEAIAVGAATGYALVNGCPGVVSLHALPGIGHAIGALHGARLMHAPIVALVGQQHSHHLHREPLLAGDIVATSRPATRWSHQPARAEDVPHAVEQAFRIATSPPMGPAVVVVPMDFWDKPARRAPVATPMSPPAVRPSDVEAVRAALSRGERVALITGDRVDDAASWDAAARVADRFDLAVLAAPIGSHPGFPTDHRRFRGTLPLSGSGVRDILAGFDTALVVGAPAFTLYLHDEVAMIPDHTDLIVVTDDAQDLARAPAQALHLGDPNAFLLDLAVGLGASNDRYRTIGAPADARELNAASAVAIVAASVPDGTVFIDESMTAGDAVRSHLSIRSPRQYVRTSTGVLGTGLSAALGAAVASPRRPVVAFVGDGAVMFAPQALWTASRMGLDLMVVVLNNGGYESLRGYERLTLQHLAPTPGAFDIDGLDLPRLAEALGVPATRAHTAAEMGDAVNRSLAHGGPALIDAQLPQRP